MKVAERLMSRLEEAKSLTDKQKIRIMKKEGSILPLKKPVDWQGKKHKQIMVNYVEKSGGKYKIIGSQFNTPSARSLDDLVNLIDWKEYEKRKGI